MKLEAADFQTQQVHYYPIPLAWVTWIHPIPKENCLGPCNCLKSMIYRIHKSHHISILYLPPNKMNSFPVLLSTHVRNIHDTEGPQLLTHNEV